MTERRLPNWLLRWIGGLRRRPREVAPGPAIAPSRAHLAVGTPPAPPIPAVRMAALLARLPSFLAERRRRLAGWGAADAGALPLWVGRSRETLAPGPRRVVWRGVLAQRPVGVLRSFPGPVALLDFVRRRGAAYRIVPLGGEGRAAAESAPAAIWPAGAVPTRPWPPAIYREELPTHEPEEGLLAPAPRIEVAGGRPAPVPSPLGRPTAGFPALAAAVRGFFRDLGVRLRPSEPPLPPPPGLPMSPVGRGEPALREETARKASAAGPPPARPSYPATRPPAGEPPPRLAERPPGAEIPSPPAGPLRSLRTAMRRLFAPEVRALPERVPSEKGPPPAPARDLPPPPRRLRQSSPREGPPPAPARDLPSSRREVPAAPAATGRPDVERPIAESRPSVTALPVGREALPGAVAAIPPAPPLPIPLAERERPGGEAGTPAPALSARSEEGGPVWRAAGPAAQTLARRIQEGLRRLGAGAPLPAAPRAFLERVLRRPLGEVRLHTGPEAAAVTGEIGAAAATVGRHVILSPTRMELGSPRGLALLAHEVVHALQRAPAGEGTPTAREEEAQALYAEEQVQREIGQPASPFPPLVLPLGRPFPPPAVPPATVRPLPAGGRAPVPGPVRAVPAAGPLRRAPAEEPAAPATAPAPSTPAAQPGQAGPAGVDVEALTEEVLRRIRHRLELEREWRGL